MQLQAIDMKNSAVGFKSRKNPSPMEQANAFVNLDDSQLKQIAYQAGYNKKDEKKQRSSIAKIFFAIPIVDTIARGILAKQTIFIDEAKDTIKIAESTFGEKVVLGAGRTAAGWAACLGAVGIYSAAKNAVVSKSDSLKQFNQNYPVMSFIGDIGLILGGLILGVAGWEKFKDNHPKSYNKILEMQSKMAKSIDKTNLSKKTFPKIRKSFANFEEKMPNLSGFGKGILRFNVYIGFGVAILALINSTHKQHKKVEKNYHALKKEQLAVAKTMVNVLDVKSDILAQQNIILAEKLKKAKSKEKVALAIKKMSMTEETVEPKKAKKEKPVEEEDSESQVKRKKIVVVYE